MIDLRLFEILKEHQIRDKNILKGGRIRGKKYYIAVVSESGENFATVFSAKLRNQRGRSISRGYPSGYEPFDSCFGRSRYLPDRMILEKWPEIIIPTGFTGVLKPIIRYARRPAFILRTPDNEVMKAPLDQEAEHFERGQVLRKLIQGDLEKLLIVLELLSWPQVRGPIHIEAQEATKVFEMQILRADIQRLNDLIALLQVPDRLPIQPTSSLGIAA